MDINYNKKYVEAKEKIAVLLKGKKGPSSPLNSSERIPPGQHLEKDRFPVLDLGIKPPFDAKTWRLRVDGELDKEILLSYQDLLAIPSTTLTCDFHCVTRWTKLDVTWKGVLWKDFLKISRPKILGNF